MLSHKMDFNCCANRDGFRRDSHIHISYSNYILSGRAFQSLIVDGKKEYRKALTLVGTLKNLKW